MVTSEHIRQSFSAALPIMLGYVAIGLPCGILETSIGLSWLQALAMSIVFYSGAGQFMIPNMYLAASPLTSIIMSVSFVNTRQMLYSASLAPFCQDEGRLRSFFFAATVTDESYGVNIERFREGGWDVARALMANLFSCSSWAVSNAVGVLIGDAIGVPLAIASFAMTSIFICLLVTQRWNVTAAVAAAASAVGVFACKCAGLSGPAILLGAVFGVAVASQVGWAMRGRGAGGSDAGGPAGGAAAGGFGAGGPADGAAGDVRGGGRP